MTGYTKTLTVNILIYNPKRSDVLSFKFEGRTSLRMQLHVMTVQLFYTYTLQYN